MEKEIIILAKSKKYGAYCVAGIDVMSGKWIRLVSLDRASHGALTDRVMRDQLGNSIEVLDKIRVHIKAYAPDGHQIENYLYDERYIFCKIGRANLQEVKQNIQQNLGGYIFYNGDRAIEATKVNKIPIEQHHSLEFIKVDRLKIEVKINIYHSKKTISHKAEFMYQGHHYRELPITDQSFIKKWDIQKMEFIKDVCLVISLGVAYEKDNRHYKLIAAVLEDKNKQMHTKQTGLFKFNFREIPF